MARKRKPSDDVYNARRRLKRQAARYEKQARSASPTESARLEQQARYLRNQAQRLYKGADTESRQRRIIGDSFSALEGVKSDKGKRRDIEAREILKTSAGKRIYGATVSIWQDSPYHTREQALIEYFGVSDLMGVIEKFEGEFGERLYSDEGEPYVNPSEALALLAILAFGIK